MGPKLLWLAGALLAPAVAQVLPPLLDSRNLPPSVWACEPQGVAVQFGEHSISCGTEVPPSAYEQPPTVTWRAANVTATYSIIVVDRDSPGAGDPNGSPQALLAVSGVAGTVLQVGLALDGTVGPPMWVDYVAPVMQAGSGCHRVYVVIFLEPFNQTVAAPRDIAPRRAWDFYVWATASQFPNSLQKVSASYFLAQNPGTDSPAVALKLLQSPNATCPAQPAAPAQQTYTLPAGQDGANVSAAEWACDGDLQVAFPAGGTACGTGFRQTDTWLPPYSSPRITWTDASPTKYYTVVIVDRDAVNRRSPLLMAAFSNISGTQLLSGFAGNSDLPGVVPWLPYVNPMPVVNSSCHRYYVFLYQQSLTLTPYLYLNFTNPSFRVNFNFPLWAARQSLSKLSVNMFQTQNAANTGENLRECVPGEPPQPGPGPAVAVPPPTDPSGRTTLPPQQQPPQRLGSGGPRGARAGRGPLGALLLAAAACAVAAAGPARPEGALAA